MKNSGYCLSTNVSNSCLMGFRSPSITKELAINVSKLLDRHVSFMEVCGTHTVAIFRHGLRELLPRRIKLISGPGCPVCVTSAGEIAAFVSLADSPKVIIATFGDLMRVPGPDGSLAQARARGARVEVVYSPMDALKLAQREPDHLVVFPAIGFETTVPTVAATLNVARRLKVSNFAIYSAHKLMPPVLNTLFSSSDVDVDGLLCPGHVSSIIGAKAYEEIADQYHIPCVVGGFEPVDILRALYLLVNQVVSGVCKVENAYDRAVSWEGNKRAIDMSQQIFEPVDAEWRGLGSIPASGLALRDEWEEFDAAKRLDLVIPKVSDPPGCLCGVIIKGSALPSDCPLFGSACTPLHPVGPCMVSSEGTCAAYYRYGGI